MSKLGAVYSSYVEDKQLYKNNPDYKLLVSPFETGGATFFAIFEKFATQ